MDDNPPVRFLVSIGSLCLFLAASQASWQDPVGDFFKRLGNSIAHPGKHPTPKPHSGKSHGADNTSAQPTVTPSPSPTPETEVVRRAILVGDKADPRRDLPY